MDWPITIILRQYLLNLVLHKAVLVAIHGHCKFLAIILTVWLEKNLSKIINRKKSEPKQLCNSWPNNLSKYTVYFVLKIKSSIQASRNKDMYIGPKISSQGNPRLLQLNQNEMADCHLIYYVLCTSNWGSNPSQGSSNFLKQNLIYKFSTQS